MNRMVLAVLVKNTSGVLARVASLFSRRGYNIDSLTVGETMDKNVSRITIACTGDKLILEQIEKQVSKLIDVIEIIDLSKVDSVFRELVLIKVKANNQTRASILEIVNVFRAKTIDIAAETLVIEMTGDRGKTNAMIELLKPYGIVELIKTGLTGASRGALSLGGADD